MAIANGSQQSASYIQESSFGVTPSTPIMKALRHTSMTLGLTKTALQSKELRSDRQIANMRHGNKSVAGDIGIELSYGSFDDFLEATLGGTWQVAITTGVAALSATATTFTRAAGDFVADGFAVGDVINSSGFVDANNNGRFSVTAVVALTLTVTALDGQIMIIEAGDADEEIKRHANVKAGVTRRSFSIERFFSDIGKYQVNTGVSLSKFNMDAKPDAMVEGSFGAIGKDLGPSDAAISGATYSAATTTTPFDSFSGVIRENGIDIGVVTSLSLSVDNGMNALFAIGSNVTLEPSIDDSNASGSMEVYFEDQVLLQKFIDETESDIYFTIVDLDGNEYRFFLPLIKYMSGKTDVTDKQAISTSYDFQALLDDVTGTNIIVERIPV